MNTLLARLQQNRVPYSNYTREWSSYMYILKSNLAKEIRWYNACAISSCWFGFSVLVNYEWKVMKKVSNVCGSKLSTTIHTHFCCSKHAKHAHCLPLQDTQEMCLLELQEVRSSKLSYPTQGITLINHCACTGWSLQTSGGCWEEATRMPAASYKKVLKKRNDKWCE